MTLPRDEQIRNLALYAPRLAYAKIAGVPLVPFVGDFLCQFPSSVVGAPPVVVALQNNITQETLVERVSFSLYQQNSFSGNPLQSLYLAQLKQCTGVGVRVDVYGGPKYTVNDVYTPLENLADIFAVTWPNGWPLPKQSNVKISFVLLQTPQSLPFDVNVTLLGWQLLDRACEDLSDAEARCRLNKLGIETPDLSTLLKP